MPPRKTPKNTPIANTPVPATPAPVAMQTPTPAAPAAPAIERSEVKGSGTKAPVAAPAATRSPTQEEIARRAFEIYASRGYAPGDQHADWIEAERQLKAGL